MLNTQQARCVSVFSRNNWCSTNEETHIFSDEFQQQQKCKSATKHPICQTVILVNSYKSEAEDANNTKRFSLSAYPSEKLKGKNVSTILLNGKADFIANDNNSIALCKNAHNIFRNSSLKNASISLVEPQISSVRGNQIVTSKRVTNNKTAYSPPSIFNQTYKLSSSLPDVCRNESAFNVKQIRKTEKSSKLKLRFSNFVNKRSATSKKMSSEEKISVQSSLKRQMSVKTIDNSHTKNGCNNNTKMNIKTSPAKTNMMSISPRKKKIFYSERQSGIMNGAPSVPPSTPACIENETVGSLADLKSQRNIIQKLLKIGSKRREKEKEIQQKGKEQEKLRLEQEKRDLIASQRRQIYYLNDIMTKLENERFLEFKAKQSGAPV